ncbi:MAG: hypothetical protein KAT05_05875 [Spirochaetes bacterium]|nr:hypothetical protein [Spirochaetota bacterium]
MDFKAIEFGLAAAEKEKSNSPHLLIEGFLDAYGHIDEIISGNKFLILGPKGSGKSAIGSKIELLSKDENYYTIQYYLGSFPYKPFSEIIPGKEAPETRYPNHWEFVLLIASLNSFINDSSCKYKKNDLFQKIMASFKSLGVLPSEDLTHIIKKTTNKNFKAGLKDVLSGSNSSEKEEVHFEIKELFSTLQKLCYSLKMDHKHYIIIDGLDDVLTQRNKQYTSLSALILAADRMNEKFKVNNVNAKIIILCRTDLFDKLPGPNNNKIRRDSGITLDWFQDVKEVKSTNLIKLINLRAKISLNKEVDVFEDYFPEYVSNRSTIKLLLENTRHTPRDIIQLLNEIQKHTNKDNTSKTNILNGIRTYSIDYFVGEIIDELNGFLSVDEVNGIIQMLGANGKSRFNLSDLKCIKDDRFKSLDLNKILNVLFNCSAIGNIKQGEYITFRYRNRHVAMNLNDDFLVHNGLRKGLNLG